MWATGGFGDWAPSRPPDVLESVPANVDKRRTHPGTHPGTGTRQGRAAECQQWCTVVSLLTSRSWPRDDPGLSPSRVRVELSPGFPGGSALALRRHPRHVGTESGRRACALCRAARPALAACAASPRGKEWTPAVVSPRAPLLSVLPRASVTPLPRQLEKQGLRCRSRPPSWFVHFFPLSPKWQEAGFLFPCITSVSHRTARFSMWLQKEHLL